MPYRGPHSALAASLPIPLAPTCPSNPTRTPTRPLGHRATWWSWLLLALVVGQASMPSDAFAQEAALQGFLIDSVTSRPLEGAAVVLEQGGVEVRSVLSDRNGLFQIPGLVAGTYLLRITLFGYADREETIQLDSGERRTANRSLTPDPVALEGINVSSLDPGAVQRELGRQTITSRDLGRVPTPAASADLVSYLQTQPGVVGTGDRGGQLFIRGGTASENLVLMDGMIVYQPFHITGFFSAFPAELVDRAEFFPGGFGPRYTGRISSVLDVRMRDGNRNRREMTASASPFLAEAVAEGPLGTQDNRLSYIVSLRRSLVEETSPWLLGEKQPLGFNSQYVRISQLARDGGSRCALTVLRTRDQGGLDPEDPKSRVGWTNGLVGGRCNTLAGETFIDARFGWAGLSSEAITRGASEFTSSVGRVFVEGDFSRLIGGMRLNTGIYMHMEGAKYDLQQLLAEDGYQEDDWVAGGAFAEMEIPLGGGVQLLPGVALSHMTERRPSAEPRLRASWKVGGLEEGELSGALGVYEQRLAGIADRRDASSIFTAWVRTPKGSRMRALHAQASWQQSLGASLSYSVDGYYRRMHDLPVTTWSTIARFTPDLSLADGRSYGGDARVEYRRGPLYLFGAYAFSWTEYESVQADFGVWYGDPVQTFHPPHDRRHQVSALASLELGHYTLGASWELGSGFPFTRPLGFDELIPFPTDGTQPPRVTGTLGETRLLLDRPYNARMPATHHLDLSVKRSLPMGSRALELQAGVINAYDRENIFYYDVFTNRRIDQLPFAPYLSVRIQPGSGTRP